MRGYRRFLRAACLGAFLIAGTGTAEVPAHVNYQGRIVDDGDLVNGSVGLSLRLYDAASGGTLLYEDSNTVMVVDGLYSTVLGDNTVSGTLMGALLETNVYMEVRVNGTAMTPREPVLTVPHALRVRGFQLTENGGVVFGDSGSQNEIHPDADYSLIAGGFNHSVETNADYAVIGGGRSHTLESNADYAHVSGGFLHRVATNAQFSSIGGGYNHTAPPQSFYATIPGGYQNLATNDAFAAGRRAKARHTGSFVWGDSTSADVESTANDQVTFRASRGFRILGGALQADASGLSNFPATVVANRTSADGSLVLLPGNETFSPDGFIGGGTNHVIAGSSPGGVITGGLTNRIGNTSADGTVSGGRDNEIDNFTAHAVIGGGLENLVGQSSAGSTISGGRGQVIENLAFYSALGGGITNRIRFNSEYSTIAGGVGNTVQNTSPGSTISGGRVNEIEQLSGRTTISGGEANRVGEEAVGSVIGGGSSNVIETLAEHGMIGGGRNNRIEGNTVGSAVSVIAGGSENTIEDGAYGSVIGGGRDNRIQAWRSVIAGGWNNLIETGSTYSVVGGGRDHIIGGGADYASIPGGWENEASGDYSLAAGRRAGALHDGTFVWADSQSADFDSTATDQFLVRAAGGVGINVSDPIEPFHFVADGSDATLLLAPDNTSSGGNSELILAEDDNADFGMRWHYDGDANELTLHGMSTSGDSGPHIKVLRDTGHVGIGTTNDPTAELEVVGTTRTEILEITGGADVAEPFDITGDTPVEPGTVLSIDPRHPGRLRVSDRAYDATVAGVASGANDVPPGLILRKAGSAADGDSPVALSGRVYCRVDADVGAIQPGDLLTTSDRPGYAMKAVDPQRRQGAILGKAMTPLSEGQGLVLILVSLQ